MFSLDVFFDFFGDVRSQMAVFEKPTGLKSHVGKQMLIFYCVFPRLSSRGPLSSASSVGSGTSAGSVNSASSARPAQETVLKKKLEKVNDFDAITNVSRRDRLFRVGETRVGVTKYAFLSIKVSAEFARSDHKAALRRP